jgi:hypothetical protein
MAFTYLTPGVVGSGGRPGDSNTNFVANGSRNSTSDVLLDGVTVVTVEQNSGVTDLKYSPAVDAVQEFKVQTNFFSAEFGQTGGAVVNMVFKSGTNDFNRPGCIASCATQLNANDWFTNRAGREKPYYRARSAGGVVGGPVIRNKTFFVIYEQHRVEEAQLRLYPDRPDIAAKTGGLLADQECCRAGDDDLQPLRHLRQCAGEPGTAAVPGKPHPVQHDGPDRAPGAVVLPLAEHAEHVDHGNQQLVRPGDFAGCQSPDELQGRPELLGEEPPDRPL